VWAQESAFCCGSRIEAAVLERPFLSYAFLGAVSMGLLTGLIAQLAVQRADQERVEKTGMLFGAGIGLFLAVNA
jgi:hypothetical protein